MKLMPLVLLLAASCFAGEVHPNQWKSVYRWSVASVVAASTFDAASSWNRYESNPILASADGRYAHRGVAIKSSVMVGSLVAQHVVLRRWPERRKAAAIVNFIGAAGFTFVATHNLRVR